MSGWGWGEAHSALCGTVGIGWQYVPPTPSLASGTCQTREGLCLGLSFPLERAVSPERDSIFGAQKALPALLAGVWLLG